LLTAGDRDFRLRVEEVQSAGLDRQADLIAGGDRRLGRDAGHGDTLSPRPPSHKAKRAHSVCL